MKNFFIISAILFSLVSCKKIDELTHFTLSIDEETTMDAIPVLPDVPIDLPVPAISTNSESTFENNNTNKDLVEDARLKVMTLEVITPEDGDFSFLDSIEIYMKADGLDEILVASKYNITGGKTVELDCVDTDLSEYVKKDAIDLRIHTTVDEITLQEYHINVHSEFYIDAKILGI